MFSDVDLDLPGKQVGFFHVPHSPHHDAWGTVRVPLAVIARGEGPTIILEGGNHGDEYEGPIVLGELIRALEPADVRGRLIFIPAINAPAVAAGLRTSPIDGKNLNRVFPGDHAGTISQQIAAYVSDELIPRADAFLSLHSGGSSLDIVPSTLIQPTGDAERDAQCMRAALAFGADTNVLMSASPDTRLSVAAASAAGLVCVATEMAGAGTVDRHALDLCRSGVRRVLAHWGVLAGCREQQPKVQSSKFCRIVDQKAYVLATDTGVFEPRHKTGDHVEEGALAGLIHFLTDPAKAPAELRFRRSGLIYARRQPGRVEPGNACCVVATPE
ncbi:MULTISPECIES: succinylglutamate desuccinylase/aspartoacylase family protein [unclassified Variovorax]|uniref:succinylglutamate desuccinylase/aspartoacylase family protein n=1 Tax=unclassified Variovorax TaxID=663243 RepID=UPI003F45D9CB